MKSFVRILVVGILTGMVTMPAAFAGKSEVMNAKVITSKLTNIGDRNKQLELPEGRWIIDRSLTIPANVNLKLDSGATFQIAKSATLTIEGNMDVPGLQQIFFGEGKVLFGAGYIKEVYPQWWGKIEGKDDTLACQRALSSGAQTIRFPRAVYAINAVGENGGADGGIKPESNTSLIFDAGSLLKAITTDKDDYAVLNISNRQNVKVDGATIEGERKTHTGKGGEWGHGIRIRKGSTNIIVKNCNVSDCWGDGIYLGEEGAVDGILVENSRFDNNRRNGCSITSAKNVLFKKCTFSNSNATSPFKGVDVEPNNAADILQNIVFEDCNSYGNISGGFSVARDDAQNTPVSVTFRNCVSENDGGGFSVDIGPSDGTGFLAIKDCMVINPGETGFRSTSANLETNIDGLYIVNPNQKGDSRPQFASGISIWNAVPQHEGKKKLAGNITARNIIVDSQDNKALYAIYINNELGDKSGFKDIDIEFKTNLPASKRLYKGLGPYFGYCDIRFAGENYIHLADGK